MRFKIDENLPADIAVLLQEAGYDAMTVLDQKLGGHADPYIASVCRTEVRALITLDMDFADIRTYPPNHYPGVVVLRLCRQDKPHVMATVAGLIPLFSTELLERLDYGSLKKTSYGSESEARKEDNSSLALTYPRTLPPEDGGFYSRWGFVNESSASSARTQWVVIPWVKTCLANPRIGRSVIVASSLLRHSFTYNPSVAPPATGANRSCH